MGLDASLYRQRGNEPREEIAYWRKNWPLQQVMERIYRAGGGKGDPNGDFNCVEVSLTEGDLQLLMRECSSQRWSGWTGDLEVFRQAQKHAEDGYALLYYCWW